MISNIFHFITLREIQYNALTKFDIKIKTPLISLIFIIVKKRNIEIFLIIFKFNILYEIFRKNKLIRFRIEIQKLIFVFFNNKSKNFNLFFQIFIFNNEIFVINAI